MVCAPGANSAQILWVVSRLARGRVEVRPADQTDKIQSFDSDEHGFVPQTANVMRIALAGLKPGTRYQWRAITESIDGPEEQVITAWQEFKTLNPSADKCHFVSWNDTHENHASIRKLQEVTPAADFLLWNGDTCNDWHKPEWLASTLLSPAGIDISKGHPLLLTMGNHDVRGKYAFKVRDYIAMPSDRPFYAFRSGPVAFICLHTGEDKPDDFPSFQGRAAFQKLREEQASWLSQITQQPEIAHAPYRIVFCHIPLRWHDEPEKVDYAGGQWDRYARSSRDLWHPHLVKWGAQAIISGHTHRPALIPANEAFPYAQITGGGHRPNRLCWIQGLADSSQLQLHIHHVEDNNTLHSLTLKPLA